MKSSFLSLLTISPAVGFCTVVKRYRESPPRFAVNLVGNSTSNFPNVYRDGGGGGRVAGVNLINFADTSVTSGPPLLDGSNGKGFESNSLVISGYNGGGPEDLHDFGNNGVPKLEVPFFNDEPKTGIWPNSAIATACGGECGIAFYPVVNRTANNTLMYNTAVNITINATGVPNAERPVKAIFGPKEVQYGSFSVLNNHAEGFLVLFGTVKNVSQPGIKMARVSENSVFDRSTYEYWNGDHWSDTAPAYDDGGYSNVFNWTAWPGDVHPPASGDIFWSQFYGTWMILFQGSGWDPRLWMSYATKGLLHTGWSEPELVYTTPEDVNYNYAIHAYPHFDETQRVIPISFCQQIDLQDVTGATVTIIEVGWANITFT